jgi:hypothetical protein
VASAAALVLGIHHGLAEGAFLVVAGVCVLGFWAVLVGTGVGALLYAPRWAALGALLSCLPFACLFPLWCVSVYGSVPPGDGAASGSPWEAWVGGVVILTLPVSCGAAIGGLLHLLRHRLKQAAGS